ncbi:FdhF/YdeP family oxidoreductase [Verticiella sediminum]|uniref:FdhF/YdeP family oxidoreductase n=1 Tax=Verticiella sediminum TaxID=1247510 RepID=A0A556A887_9BURK|nr:FdhF/YdeP family oxidoreductase [Verticiella sediminum]TSH89090.1 FdhF/YdeP family oxidoreductase [Verticiella sediminum]
MSSEKIRFYSRPAGGWGALKSVASQLLHQDIPWKGARTLLSANQPDGFDCPGCAWPDKDHASTFEFCENGVKAVAAEATARRVGPEFFARHTVTELLEESDFFLEDQGRLTEPMVYDALTDRYRPIAWDDAFALVARHLNALASPDQAIFYTSGRTSNEAAFLYQLFVREFGTNNFPDCSNMCHEPSGVGLKQSIGVGKGTVTLDDFELADAIFIFGQNPGTNHPRMLGELRRAAKRGAAIVSFNPLRERGLEKFADPQDPLEMLTGGGTRISSDYFTVRIGGDLAAVMGMIKHVLELDAAARAAGRPAVLDDAFIAEHTQGCAEFVDDIRAQSWTALERASGLSEAQLRKAGQAYADAGKVIVCWGMGITQHRHSVATIHMLVNLLLLRGNLGRPGAGVCPVRGHSNVQGDRTMGIYEKPAPAFLDRLREVFGFEPPREPGYDTIGAIEAMRDGKARVFFGMGGNFAMATPDSAVTWAALQRCELTVHVSTKLNRSHLLHGREALILPCLGRTEIDVQAAGPQGVTVEDSMSMVHLSSGINPPASTHLLSEPAIVARLAAATLAHSRVSWLWLIEDYARIRTLIERVFDDFEGFAERVAVPGGFRLRNPASEREWCTASGKAEFRRAALPAAFEPAQGAEPVYLLATVRSHDQYNTTVYGMNDRYRGVYGQRRVVFIHPEDLAARGWRDGDRVDLVTAADDGSTRRAEDFRLVAYDIPRGCLASYYPETNGLVPLSSYADEARTPASKSVPVKLVLARAGAATVQPRHAAHA